MIDAVKLASKIKVTLNPTNVLVLGCEDGSLVQALHDSEINADGLAEFSDGIGTSGGAADQDTVGSPVNKIDGHWDLIVCIDVLGSLSTADAETAIDTIAAASTRVLFAEQASLSVSGPATWAASFAERGLIRRTDVDFGAISPRAMLFERQSVTIRDLVFRYESEIDALSSLTLAQRHRLLTTDKPAKSEEISRLRRELLIGRDHAIGAEAELGTLRAENLTLHHQIARTQADLAQQDAAAQHAAAMRASTTWKVGRMIVGPLSRLRRLSGR